MSSSVSSRITLVTYPMVERKKSTPKVAPKKAAEPKVSVKKEVAPAKKEIPPKKSASRKTKTPVVEVVSDSESETEILEPIAPPEKKKASTPKKVAPRKGKKVAAPEPEDDGFELLGSPQIISNRSYPPMSAVVFFSLGLIITRYFAFTFKQNNI